MALGCWISCIQRNCRASCCRQTHCSGRLEFESWCACCWFARRPNLILHLTICFKWIQVLLLKDMLCQEFIINCQAIIAAGHSGGRLVAGSSGSEVGSWVAACACLNLRGMSYRIRAGSETSICSSRRRTVGHSCPRNTWGICLLGRGDGGSQTITLSLLIVIVIGVVLFLL